jgi:hypothetical protein
MAQLALTIRRSFSSNISHSTTTPTVLREAVLAKFLAGANHDGKYFAQVSGSIHLVLNSERLDPGVKLAVMHEKVSSSRTR